MRLKIRELYLVSKVTNTEKLLTKKTTMMTRIVSEEELNLPSNTVLAEEQRYHNNLPIFLLHRCLHKQENNLVLIYIIS